MFNPTQIIIDAFVNILKTGYHRTYGGYKPDYADIISWAGGMALENIANSDALYHNIEHTIIVTLVGQEILRGKHIREGGISCEDWLHFIISLLCHDIGYVKGVCRQDKPGFYATGVNGEIVALPDGTTDASLAPYRVERGKLFINERFGGHKIIDVEQIERNIEMTRFPVADTQIYHDTASLPGLVLAADLIGQLSDPGYFRKIGAIFYEFEEIGINQKLGYKNPGDLQQKYSKYFWDSAYPYIQEALRYLSLTQQGKQIIANLQANVFVLEYQNSEKYNQATSVLLRASRGAA